MWRFKQQRNTAGERLNVYHVEEGTAVIGVFVFMNALHSEAVNLDEIVELYTSDEMDEEFQEGLQEGYREAGGDPSTPPSPSPEEGLVPRLTEQTPLRVV